MNESLNPRLMARLTRLLPPVARLQIERRELLDRIQDLENRLSRQAAAWERGCVDETQVKMGVPEAEEAAQLRRELDYVKARRDQGFLIEIDYATKPRVRSWSTAKDNDFCGRIIRTGRERYQTALQSSLALVDYFVTISATEPFDERQPWWNNPWFPPLDAICLTALLVKLNPRRYIEVGSGNSTKYVRRAISGHCLRTKIISIDPHPRAVIDILCDQIIRENFENCDLSLFSDLGAEDLIFIDNSHRCFQNSDVTVFFTEVLPALKSGCHYGIHDIFLPNDYPQEWLARYYNEQYLLMCYLLGGAAGDEIVMPVHYVQHTQDLLAILDPITRHPALGGAAPAGGAFWMRKS